MDGAVQALLDGQAPDIRAHFLRIVRMIQSHGLERLREPYVKHLEGRVWEMRLKGKDGIARAAYVTATGRRVVVVHVFTKKNPEDAAAGDRDRLASGTGGSMTRKFIPVEESFAEWRKDPAFMAAYDALEDEYALASALIEARGNMTQAQVAAAMGTTQAAVARLESGRIKPTTRTLEQYAKATHTKLRIKFERDSARN